MKLKVMKRKEVEEIIRAEVPWEPVGPTPMPDVTDLRNWDMRLLKTYKPFYAPFCDLCCFCTYGKCDLTAGKRGACGIDINTQQARIVLLACCMGLACHGGHARYIIDYLIEKYGEDYKIDLGPMVAVEAPIIRTVLGLKPETLGDLRKAIEYVERELLHLLSATHTGQEGGDLDFESKSLHAGMIDHVALECADIAEIVGFKYPTSVAETPLVEIGWGAVDRTKPIILLIGHNPATGHALIDYLEANNLIGKVEVCGICCTAHEIARHPEKPAGVKIIGPLSRQLFFVKTGLADVIITDEQCVRTDIPQEARKVGAALITVTDKICYNLENVTEKPVDEIVKDVVKGKHVLILDPEKAGEVAAKVALELAPRRKKELIQPSEAMEHAKRCRECGMCEQVCPNLLFPGSAMKREVSQGVFNLIKEVFEKCIGCGKCQQDCPQKIPILKIMQLGASTETFKIRSGRGPIMDVEIRKVGSPIVLGIIPGVVAFVGCSNYPEEMKEVAEMMEEFARRKYIVVASGCAAMAAAFMKDAEGLTIYEKYPPDFDAGGIVNVGPCVANAHIAGAVMKVANIFAKLPLRANYEVIADYALNRIGACGVAWGAYSQKAAAIATGFNRLGVPVVLGPHSSKYRRLYLSRKEEDDWRVMDGRKKELVDTQEPSPEHLINVVESKERAMITIAKLCIRRNDTPMGRQVKLHHYIDLYKKFMGTLPDDLHLYVRKVTDIPMVFKREVMEYLKEVGWKEKPVLTLPTLIGTYPTKVPIEAVIR